MRDTHRLKEKYDLSLDNRQIVSLMIGGMVVLGTVFVLGVVVGKKLEGSGRTAGAADLLSALDEKAAALHQARQVAEPQLTFQEELTKRSTGEVPPAASPPEAVAVIASAGLDPDAGNASNVVAAPPLEGKVAPSIVPVRTALPDGGLKQAIARTEKRPVEAVENGGFTLQLSASQSKAEADKFAGRLKDQGYAPYIIQADVPGRGTWYRVRMGSFASKEAATRYLQDFRRETRLEAFVAQTE
jgi:DedD protein